MRKILTLVLVCVMLMVSVVPAYAASSTLTVVDSIHEIVSDMYDSAESAPQQTSAAALGSMYMLNIILNEISSNQARRDAVSKIVSTIGDEVSKVDGAPQVSSLSLYGCVYILSAIAYEYDTFGLYSILISSATDALADADPNSAVQEMALASYRMVDLLEVIALEKGVSSTTVTAIDQILRDNNEGLEGAPQQTANGLYRAAELIYYIAQEDCSAVAAYSISSLLDSMYEDNDLCQSAVQQTSNGMVTVYMMLRSVAQDKA